MAPSISLKALVDKASKKVIFIESGNEFVDVLFSFLTIPMATIIKCAGDIYFSTFGNRLHENLIVC